MSPAQSTLDEFLQDSPQTIIERVQRRAREALASQNTVTVEVSR
jgi:hypothetical protein